MRKETKIIVFIGFMVFHIIDAINDGTSISASIWIGAFGNMFMIQFIDYVFSGRNSSGLVDDLMERYDE